MKRIEPVSIEFNDSQTPYSPIFQDVYYSIKTGIEESIYLYLEGSGFTKQMGNVGEIGFGVGLNFLLTYRHFLENAEPHQKLTYLSVEKFPVKIDGLKKLYSQYPDLKKYSDELIAQYPVLVPGIHTLSFAEGRVRLILMFGDAQEMFSNLNLSHQQKIQHWYLDGFAPKKNPEAFQENLFKSLLPVTAKGAVGTSFTSAGWVRRSLTNAGCTVEKRKGFGTKRESIFVHFPEPSKTQEKPWFSEEKIKKLKPGDRIVVLGAGLSGTAIARALAERGFSVTLIDQEGIAAQASGNAAGLFNIQLSKLPNPISRFSQLSLTHFLREVKKLGIQTHQGILRLDAVREKENFDAALNTSEYPDDFYEKKPDGIYFPKCGILSARKVCETRAQHQKITFLQRKVHSVEKTNNGFFLKELSGKIIHECEHVVYAPGSALVRDEYLKHPLLNALPLRPIRGQIVYLSPTPESKKIDHSLVDSGYLTPIVPEVTGMNAHCVGATYQAKTVSSDQEEIDRKKLLEEAKEKHPAFSTMNESNIVSSRVGYRLSTPDKLPMIGPLCDPEKLKAQYHSAFRGSKVEGLTPLNAEDGEWIFLGMGSRGITFSSYGAEILASLMCGETLPIEADLWEHLHSSRFIVRNLKRG